MRRAYLAFRWLSQCSIGGMDVSSSRVRMGVVLNTPHIHLSALFCEHYGKQTQVTPARTSNRAWEQRQSTLQFALSPCLGSGLHPLPRSPSIIIPSSNHNPHSLANIRSFPYSLREGRWPERYPSTSNSSNAVWHGFATTEQRKWKDTSLARVNGRE